MVETTKPLTEELIEQIVDEKLAQQNQPNKEWSGDSKDNRRGVTPESGFKKNWRPGLAWIYVLICLFDFVLAPIMMTVYYETSRPETMKVKDYLNAGFSTTETIEIIKTQPSENYQQWQPLTLQAGGFFHIAMGGILGIGSYTRGKEKQMKVEKGSNTD